MSPPNVPKGNNEPASNERNENEMSPALRTGTSRSTDRAASAPTRVNARDLLGPSDVVQIEHEGELYTLRLTRNNKLILTK